MSKPLSFKTISLTGWIFICLLLGILVGIYFPDLAHFVKPLRTVFLNGIKCIIAPLIFSSIVTGICSAGNLKGLGRIGFRAIIWFEIATTVALFVGLTFVNLVQPGNSVDLSQGGSAGGAAQTASPLTFAGFLEHFVPTNFVDAVAKGDVLQLVVFSLIFGIALLMAGPKGQPVLTFCESLAAVMFKFTDLIMRMAPIGVGAAIAGAIAEHGLKVMSPMLVLVLTLYLALIAFVFATLVPALLWARVKVLPFFREIRPHVALAFATTSSESAYPGALESLQKMGVPTRVSSFILPLGYSFNLDGSTLYLAMASIFIAQASHVPMGISKQIALMLTLMVTTKGVAAVPRASIVVLSATLGSFGLPLEGIALILGVDEFMDMARTSINLLGNCVATVVVNHWEGEKLNPEFQRP